MAAVEWRGHVEIQGIYASAPAAVACGAPGHAVRGQREMSLSPGVCDNANVRSQEAPPAVARRAVIRELATRHGLDAVRWWPPNDGDLLVEGLPLRLRQLRSDLERALGCKVAIYLSDHMAGETRDRLLRESVDLLAWESPDGPALDV
jgi:hypothetical protein